MYVYFYLFARAGLAKLDASMLEAAQALGAGRWETLRRVALPLLRPSLAGAALLVFMTALGSFSAPYVFGGGFRVMTTQIVATKLNGELPLAMVETVALALVATLGLVVLRRTEGNDILAALGKGIGPLRRPIRRGGVRALATGTGGVLAARLVALPWALPGTVFAVALATTFGVAQPWALRWVLVGTVALLPLAYLVRNLPVTGRAVLAGYRQLDPAVEEAAASLGAGPWATFRRVTLPLLKPALAAGGSIAFVAALGDFVTSVVLYTYDNRPISIEIMGSLRISELGVAAAFGVMLMLASALVLGLGARR